MKLSLTFERVVGPAMVEYKPPMAVLALVGSEPIFVQPGQLSESRAVEAAKRICDRYNKLVANNVYEPAESYEEDLEERYIKRGEIAPRIMGRWAAYNDRKIASGEWDLIQFEDFMKKIGPIFTSLYSTAFGSCLELIKRFDHPLATEEAKNAYIQIMASEYPEIMKAGD